ncbi:MAG: hypothetical protein IPG71_12965 [bacterium]|nr:hypothetical protein [bacterium]
MIYLILLLLTSVQAFAGGSIFGAQPTMDQVQNSGVRSIGLGGAGLALWDSLGMHTDNAAQIGALTGTMLRAGMYSGLYMTTDADNSDSDGEFNWQPFRLYLRVHPRYKIALGIDPLRRADVRTFAQDSLAFESDTGTVYQPFEQRVLWQGSATDFRLDNAFVLSSRVSLGATIGFLSEYLETRSTLDFPQPATGTGARDAEYSDRQRFSGVWGSASVLVRPNDHWSVGGFWRSNANGDWDIEQYVNHGGENLLSQASGDRPGGLGIGVGYRWTEKWAAYADVRQQSWKIKQFGPVFENQGFDDVDAFAVMGGVEKLGGTRLTDEGFDRWDYRAGIAYRMQPWQVIDAGTRSDVSDVALNLGVSLPLAQNAGKLNLALELGNRSASDFDLSENYTRFYLQLDMHERWFQRERRKLRD